MTTADQYLLKIISQTDPTIESLMSTRDSRVLRSLASAVSKPNFITENQGKLLLKIFKEYSKKLEIFGDEILTILEDPRWSKIFRPVDKTKKIFLSNDQNGDLAIFIEFAFSANFRKIIMNLGKKISNLQAVQNGKFYIADLTEKNIVQLVDTFEPHEFEIDEKIKNHYDTIKSWSENEISTQFLLTNITHQNFQKQMIADLGVDTRLDDNILRDRSNRYLYLLEKTEKNPENLTEKIAHRNSQHIWINRTENSLTEIFQSLKNLRRLPCLVVFELCDNKKYVEELEILRNSLKENEITDQIGIYFRLDNDAVGAEFNKIIAEENYNSRLGSLTQVVGIQSGKIPKFLLKSQWTPMSVVNIGRSMQKNKTAVYSQCCDLIINYSYDEPILEKRIVWELD